MQYAYNSVPPAKQAGPLTLCLTAVGGILLFDNQKEAEDWAALQFSQGAGKTAVMVFELTKVAMPAVPKVEFAAAKKAE